ncbi:uncharacterized protein LOC110855462 [Folsomia candida]|uniref:uncharacterized protein LOC110855462 n=1 Tax=Folsomia candida TaxID=158441 RepID=UPI000B8F9289|nr:uncharacterized protein LOC110855462 [Folsomia candida]
MIISDGNYDIAWAQLQDRYQNERELLFAILRRLLNQPQVQSHSSVSIRKLVDVSQECIRSLEVLSLPTNEWDAILLFIVITKMDSSSKELWEQSLKDGTIPKLKSLFEFLEQRARALSASGNETTHKNQKSGSNSSQAKVTRSHSHPVVHHSSSSSPSSSACKACDQSGHYLFRCDKFLEWSIPQRVDFVRKGNLCFNCLQGSHRANECPSNKACKTCGAKHHTLLHLQTQVNNNRNVHPPVVHFTAKSSPVPNEYDTLLATVLVKVTDDHGKIHTLRVLADNGSNSNFITDSCIKRIGIQKKRCFTSATGLGGAALVNSTGVTSFSVSSRFDSSVSFFLARCLVTKKITGKIPSSAFDHTKWPHLQGLLLADPGYHSPQDVDMLLGAEFFFAILDSGKISGPPTSPVAIKTSFGWLIGGGSANPLLTPSVHTIIDNATTTSSSASDLDDHLDTTPRRFWEIESEPLHRLHSQEEVSIESHFASTNSRDHEGRFMVQLPFRTPRLTLGSSLNIAMKRLLYLERGLQRNQNARTEYNKFMQEYEALGHMEKVTAKKESPNQVCYLPHQFVLKESSSTTKFRVVFDASAKTANGVSLNDCLMVGPTIQDSLVDIISRFRLHKIAFAADIAKMYRQIRVSPADADMQRILWREDPSKPVQHYSLSTVTYGTASASFLATRSLKELVIQNKAKFPRAAEVVLRYSYMDDDLSGEPSLPEALETVQQLLQLMKDDCLELRKWSSNCQALLDALPPELRETSSLLSLDQDSTIKTLGIYWNTKSDQFFFRISPQPPRTAPLTKRIVLQEIARLYDPSGWLAPIVITAKIFMQSLWKVQQGWDDPLSSHLQNEWINFRKDLESLSNLTIDRFYMEGSRLTCPSLNAPILGLTPKFCLAGFCDASQKSYAAAVYLCVYYNGSSSTSLVSSKTRIAPVKVITLPRLELCGADILADLLISFRAALRIPIHSMTAWTDSTCALAWIQSPPARWKTFIANRVTKIQEKIPPTMWGHTKHLVAPSKSTLTKLIPFSIDAFPYSGTSQQQKSGQVISSTAAVNPLSISELDCAQKYWIRITQQQEFQKEIHALVHDPEGILKVGGRLRISELPMDQKHPTILPIHSRLTQLLIEDTHTPQGPDSTTNDGKSPLIQGQTSSTLPQNRHRLCWSIPNPSNSATEQTHNQGLSAAPLVLYISRWSVAFRPTRSWPHCEGSYLGEDAPLTSIATTEPTSLELIESRRT